MELAHRWADRNLSRLELVASCAIIFMLLGYSMRSMLIFFARTEKTMVETSIMNINSALSYQAVIAQMRGDKAYIARLQDQNPFDLVQVDPGLQSFRPATGDEILDPGLLSLNTMPANFLGELDDPAPGTLDRGNWYFDRSDKTLNYLVRNAEFFHSDSGDVPRIKLRVVIDYNDKDGNGEYNADIDIFKSVRLQTIGTYSWAE